MPPKAAGKKSAKSDALHYLKSRLQEKHEQNAKPLEESTAAAVERGEHQKERDTAMHSQVDIVTALVEKA